jgi:hypothetical protein
VFQDSFIDNNIRSLYYTTICGETIWNNFLIFITLSFQLSDWMWHVLTIPSFRIVKYCHWNSLYSCMLSLLLYFDMSARVELFCLSGLTWEMDCLMSIYYLMFQWCCVTPTVVWAQLCSGHLVCQFLRIPPNHFFWENQWPNQSYGWLKHFAVETWFPAGG